MESKPSMIEFGDNPFTMQGITNPVHSKGNFLAFVFEESGQKVSLRAGDVNFGAAEAAFEAEDYEALKSALNVSSLISGKLNGDDRFVVADGQVTFNGAPLNGALADRIVQFCQQPDLDATPVIKFVERVYANPNTESVSDLYDFLSHKNMPIGNDGRFYAYKGITDNYLDAHSKSVSNKLGATPEMPRSDVAADRTVHCGKGYHVGSFSFANNFSSRLVVIAVDPADVVSVPSDANCQKMRICKYEVVAETGKKLDMPFWDPSSEPRADKNGVALVDGATYKATTDFRTTWKVGDTMVWDASSDSYHLTIGENVEKTVPFLNTIGVGVESAS